MDYTSIKVGQLPTEEISGSDFIPHEVNGLLKKATITDLAAFIGANDAVGFRAVSVPNGGTLPTTDTQEFILVGPGTYNNVGGGSTITVTEELNALVSNGTYWFVGVEIPIDAPPGNAVWGEIVGTLSNQTDLQSILNLKADLVAGKVPSSQLPSYVDDVVEVADFAALPVSGETGKIYVTLDSGFIYRWTGTIYVRIADEAPTWGAIVGTLSDQTDLQSALNAKEDDIAAGTTAQYWRGDKSWQTLNKSAVGLGNVDNTSDADKPISTATQTALDGKFDDPTGDTTQYIAGDGSLITFPVAGQAGTVVREVRNVSGATITKGTVVYINGASGNKPTIAKALATGDSTSAQTFGLVQADISNNANGYVVCVGDIIGLNTSSITEGSQLYLSSTTAGAYTTTKQLAPAHLVYVGVVTRSHASLGQIEVKIQNGYELDELHDVAISSKTNKDFLTYESSSDLWKNKSLGTILGGTSSQFIKGDGSLDSTSYLPLSGGTMTGQIVLKESSSSTDYTKGLRFPNDPFGGISDISGIRLYASSGESQVLEIYIGNDSGTDKINFATGSSGGLSNNDVTINGNIVWNAGNVPNPISGTGNSNFLPKFSGTNVLANSKLYENSFGGIQINNTNTNGAQYYTVRVGPRGNNDGVSSIWYIPSNASPTVGWATSSGSTFYSIATLADDITRMHIASDGKVGIGTASPSGGIGTTSTGTLLDIYDGTAIGSNGGALVLSALGNSSRKLNLAQIRSSLTDGTPGSEKGEIIFSTMFNASLSVRMRIGTGGDLNLTTLGTGLVYSNGGTLTSTNPSDERLKDDITDLQFGLNEILQLRPVSYLWKNDTINQGKQFGFIAQEVQEIIPELVKEFTTIEDEEEVVRLGLDKEAIFVAMVNAIKELKSEIELLKAK